MRVLVAPDSFKENMDAATAAAAITRGIHRVDPTVVCVQMPIADGGEGLVSVLAPALSASVETVEVTGPMGEPTRATYGFSAQTSTAVIEVAEACGIHLVPREKRDIWHASTLGVGELLAHVRSLGARRIVVGLGGSVTNDGGVGMLSALGARIVDADGRLVEPSPSGLRDATSVSLDGMDGWEDVEIILASDVVNPLLGPNGASAVFGPQKGASSQDVPFLDAALRNWAELLWRTTGVEVADLPGAGAAGGLGAAFMAGLGAKMASGIDTVLELSGFDEAIAGADLAFTGEGKIDSQTAQGKAPWGLCQAALSAGVRTVAFCGVKGVGASSLIGPHGFLDVVEISDPTTPLEVALREGPQNIAAATEKVFRQMFPPAGQVPTNTTEL